MTIKITEAEQKELESIDLELKRVELEQKRMALELTKRQVQEFKDKEQDEAKKRMVRIDAIKKAEETNRQVQSICKHKTGGRGKPGWFNGDGRWGYAVSPQKLPTGEIYFICFRCQKEWHMPKKGDVVRGLISMEQYKAQAKEYMEVAAWDKPYFEGSEICASVQFHIPELLRQENKDAEAFAKLEQ